jgi:hypothetical protein
MRLPSIRTIQLGFPSLSKNEVKSFRQILERFCGNPPKCLEKLNTILEAYGVEVTQESEIISYRDFYGIEYVNMGESYTTTVIYDYRKERFYITSWGDYVEKEYKRFFS